MAVSTYRVRLTWWTRSGLAYQDFSAEGSRPSVAIHQAMRSAELSKVGSAVRKGILSARIVEGPPGFRLPSGGRLAAGGEAP